METLVLDNSRAVIARGDAVENASAAAWAVAVDESVQRLSAQRVVREPAPLRVVAWSGSMAEELFGEDPRTWGAPGWSALEAACVRVAPVLRERGVTLVLRTHARHVLSDIPSCVRFARERAEHGAEGGLIQILLDPVSMLAPSMLPLAEDHLRRIVEVAPAMGAGLAGILIGPGAEGEHVREAAVLARLMGKPGRPDVPVIVDRAIARDVAPLLPLGNAPA